MKIGLQVRSGALLLLSTLLAGCVTTSKVASTHQRDGRTTDEFIASLPADHWQEIAAEDLLVIEWQDEAEETRRTVIRLIDTDYGRAWGGNVRALSRQGFFADGAFYRVIPGFVAQWGLIPPPEGEEEPADPAYLAAIPQGSYSVPVSAAAAPDLCASDAPVCDSFVPEVRLVDGWVFGSDGKDMWPLACVGTVGVARSMAPDMGSGVALYAMMRGFHRRLDRNLGIVGRVIEGFEHLEALPAASPDKPEEATRFTRVTLVSDMPMAERPRYRMLRPDSESHIALRRYLSATDDFLQYRYATTDACDPRLVPIQPID